MPLAKNPSVYLMETPEAKAFLLLLECFQSEFPRETLMDFLACPNLNPEGFGLNELDWNPHLWDQASKEAGVVEGEGAWMDRLKEYQPAPARAEWEEGDISSQESRSLSAFRPRFSKRSSTAGTSSTKKKIGWGRPESFSTWPKSFSELPTPRNS